MGGIGKRRLNVCWRYDDGVEIKAHDAGESDKMNGSRKMGEAISAQHGFGAEEMQGGMARRIEMTLYHRKVNSA
jgi:hypothetical protein